MTGRETGSRCLATPCCISSQAAIAEILPQRLQPEESRSHILEDALQHHMTVLMQIQTNDISHTLRRVCTGMEQASNRQRRELHKDFCLPIVWSPQKFTDSAHRNLNKPMISAKSHACTIPPNHAEAQTHCSCTNCRTYLETTAT